MQRQKGPAAMGAQSHATESASVGRPRPKIWTQCTVLCLPLLVTVLLGLAGAVAYGLYSLGAALGVARTACGVIVALVTPAVVAGDPRTVTRWCWPSPVLSVVFGPIVVPRVIATAIALQWRAWGNRSAAATRTTHTDWEVLSLPGVELSKRIAAGELTAEGLARLCIARLEAVNPELNAVVGTRFPQALDEARAIDTRLASVDFDPTTASPLLGVPTVVKECHEVVGMPFTGGVVGRLDAVGEATCPAVQKAMDAGMVVLGVTNTSEACMFHESNNPIYGLTKNPYSLNHSAGGSSGGSAAACAAGAVPVAVASDVGGSIRIPSHFCGLFGHKPTGGTGTGGVDRFCQLGPTTRHAVDLMPFLRLLSKPTAPQSALTDPDATLAGVTIFILDTSVGSPALRSRVDPDQSDALEAAVGALTKAGVTVKPLPAVFANKLTSGNNAFDWWSSCMDLEKSTPFAEVITEGVDGWAGQWIPLVQFVAATLGVSTQHSLPAAGLAVVEMANGLMPESYIRGKAAELEEMKRSLTSLLGEDGVILLPTLPTTAFRHHEGLIRFFDVASTCLFNVLEFPATTIPCGLSATSRLPRGVQCVGPCGADHRTIAVALKLEHLGVARWEKPF